MFFMRLKHLIIVLLTTVSPIHFAMAAHTVPDSISVELHFKPDVENGKRVYEICASCHLPDGWGNRDGVYPQLAGQHATVLMQQLLDIREGRRDNPAMFPFVQERSIGGYQNLADVVAYISTLPMTPFNGRGKWGIASPEYQQGKQIFEQKCTICHGEQAEGNSSAKHPRLQGQHYAYLIQQARLITSHQRIVNPAMTAAIESLSVLETEAVMNYISRIKVPEEDLHNLEQEQKP